MPDTHGRRTHTIGEPPSAGRSARHRIWLIPVAAVAIVVAVAGGVYALTGPSEPSRTAVPPTAPMARSGSSAPLADRSATATGPAALPAPPPAYPSLRPSGPPRFILTVPSSVAHFAHKGDKEASSYTPMRPVVQDAVTGKVLATIQLPAGMWSSWPKVAAAPDDRTFVIAGMPRPAAGEFQYFRVHLDEHGSPQAPTLVPGLTVPQAASTTPALSPDGRRLAYCAGAAVDVVDTVTGQRRSWPLNGRAPSHLTWSPDGRTLALIGLGLRTLDTGSATARPVDVTLPGGIGRGGQTKNALVNAAYAPDRTALIAEIGSALERVPLGGGAPAELGPGAQSGDLSVDGTGRYALYSDAGRLFRVDLRTGRRTSLPIPEDVRKSGAVASAW